MKLDKIFIVSLLLLAIIAMGAVSASEDIADDTITAIDPTDEAVSESVDEIEPADEIITQTVEEEPTEEIITQTVEEEPTEETLAESVDEIEIEESTDSNEALTDAEDDFEVIFYNNKTKHQPIIIILSHCQKNGFVRIYVDDTFKREWDVENGLLDYYGEYVNNKEISPSDLGIQNKGTYAINVTFKETGSETETVLKTGQVSITDFNVNIYESFYSMNSQIVGIYSENNRNGIMNIYVDGEIKANLTTKNGMFYKNDTIYGTYLSFQPSDLGINGIGLYNIKVEFVDNETLAKETLQEKKVALIICQIDDELEEMGSDEKLNYVMEFPGINSGNVTIYLYDNNVKGKKLASGKIVNGKATVEISGLAPMAHEILIEYSTPLGKGQKYMDLDVKKTAGKVTVSVPSEITEGSNAIITLNVSSFGRLKISVDGKLMRANSISSFKYIIPDLTLGTHYVRVVFIGDYVGYDENLHMSIYEPYFSKSFKITVKAKPVVPAKTKTTITASKVTAIYNSAAKTLSVTLKDAKDKVVAGKSITVALNGKTYKATTNANGIAKFKIPTKLVPKTYTATIKFAGDSKYIASSGSAKVLVKKAKVKIKAAKKTFKVKAKTKKVKATLKDNKGKVMKKVKLTLKIGKKTYKAKTNKKGIATFKVKLAKKGKYTGKIKFAGNKYFKAATKKVKITVKK